MRLTHLPAVAAAAVLLAGSTTAIALAADGADDVARPTVVEDRVVQEPHHVVPVPAAPAKRVAPARTRKQPATTRTRVRHIEPADDRGTHVEPGDDRGTHVEPGDDRGTHVEPGDDGGHRQRGKSGSGSSGRGGSDDGGSHS